MKMQAQDIIYRGKTYASLQDMPAGERASYERVEEHFADSDANGVPDIFEGKGKLELDLGTEHPPPMVRDRQQAQDILSRAFKAEPDHEPVDNHKKPGMFHKLIRLVRVMITLGIIGGVGYLGILLWELF